MLRLQSALGVNLARLLIDSLAAERVSCRTCQYQNLAATLNDTCWHAKAKPPLDIRFGLPQDTRRPRSLVLAP